MKVTFCAYDVPNYVGGPNAWLRRLVPELREHDVQPRVLFLTQAKPEACPTVQALRQQGIKCVAIRWPPYTEQSIRWLLKQLAEDPAGVFVPNLMVAAYYAGRWAREAGIPTVGVLHSDDAFHHGLLSEFVFGPASYQISTLVSVSRLLEQLVLERHPPATRIWRIPYGVPLPRDLSQEPNGRFSLAYVGRLVEPQKRISEVTRALCQVVRDVPNCEALIYGDGPARPAVEQILRSEGQGLPVHLVGRVDSDEMQGRLAKHHALVLLSDYEGLPIALMEGMACGLVPICLRARSGIPELVEDGVTGLLVDNRGSSFVNAVRQLQADPDLWARLSRAARAKIETEYSSEAGARRWAEMLHELHGQAGSRHGVIVPQKLDLPPVHPDLAREDKRTPNAMLRVIHCGRRLGGRIKRRLIGR